MKFLSVVMPTYNSADYLTTSIKSILNQSYKNFELLIIDDGSEDNIAEIISQFSDPRIKFFKKQHTGLSDTLNYGLELANSEIIMRMDADDISLPYRFQKQYSVLLKTNCDVISSWYAIFYANKIRYVIKTSTSSAQIKKKMLLYSEISHPGCLIKKNSIKKIGGYLENQEAFVDYELWLRGRNKLTFYNLPEILIMQRYRSDSLSRADYFNKMQLHYDIQRPYYKNEILKDFGLANESQILNYRGWREYFYGDKSKARVYWRQLRLRILFQPRILIAYIITFLPNSTLFKFKESRVRFRLKYWVSYFTSENLKLRKEFKSLLKQTSQ